MAVMNPLGDKNVIVIDDNYIGECANAYAEAGRKIDNIIIKYTGILNQIVDDGSLKGLTADKLYEFALTANMLISQTAGILCNEKKVNMEKFAQNIDEADEEIY